MVRVAAGKYVAGESDLSDVQRDNRGRTFAEMNQAATGMAKAYDEGQRTTERWHSRFFLR